MRHKKVISQETFYTTCDLCDGVDKPSVRHHSCSACGRDVCRDCLTYWHRDPFDGSDGGDYPTVVCNDCHSLSTPFAEKSRAALEDAWYEEEKCRQAWHDECTRTVVTKEDSNAAG